MTDVLITDYTSLKTAVADWLYRAGDQNIADRAAMFIDLFERSFMRTARTLEMQQIDTAVLTGAVVPLPPGYLEAIRFQLTGIPANTPNQVLEYVTPARSGMLDAAQSGGIVKNYTILANQIVISPQSWTPIGATLEATYYAFVQLANADDGVNWLLSKHPDAYLYGALMQGAAYIDDKETVAFWKEGRDGALSEILEADKKAKVAGPLCVSPSMRFRTRFRTPSG